MNNKEVIINELFSSIKTIAQKEISSSGLTKTVIGNIVSSKRDEDGAYAIDIEGHRTKGFPLYPRAYVDGEIVIILVSSSGMRGRNFILGVASSIYGGKIVDRSDPIISLKTEINIQQGLIETTVEKVEKLEGSLDSVAGADGKNLVLNSGFFKEFEGIIFETPDQEGVDIVKDPEVGMYAEGRYTLIAFPIDKNELPIGTKMNLSFMVKSSEPTSTAEVMVGRLGAEEFQLYTGPIEVTSSWGRVDWNFETTELLEDMYVMVASSLENVYPTNIMLINSTRPLEWVPNPEDFEDTIEQIKTDVANIQVTPEFIISTVTSSTEFTELFEGKANMEDLNAYLTSEEYQNLSEVEQERVDAMIDELKGSLGEYVTSSELEQTAEAITGKFVAAGGINLVKNSIGFAGTDFWTESIQGIRTVQTNELEQLGFGSGWFSEAGKAAKLVQEVIIPNGPFTLSCYINKFSATSGKVRVYVQADSTIVSEISPIELTNGFVFFSRTFKPDVREQYSRVFFAETVQEYKVYIEFDADVQATITGLMLNIGEVPLQWSMARGEVYNTNIKMDLSGIKVAKIEEEKEVKYTVMTPDKFAGYYDVNKDGVIDNSNGSPDEVFRMDEDEFVMKKAAVREEINMGTIKVLKIETSTSSGWAFIGNV